jgi:hypothetical protein
MDHNVPLPITNGLRLRDVDVLTAYEDGYDRVDDVMLLDRATALGRVLFTRDEDLLAEADKRQQEDIPFGGVIFAHQLRVSIGTAVNDLELVAQVSSAEDMHNRIQFLPL